MVMSTVASLSLLDMWGWTSRKVMRFDVQCRCHATINNHGWVAKE